MKMAKSIEKKDSLENIHMPEVVEGNIIPGKTIMTNPKLAFADAVRTVQQQMTVRERYNLFIGETSFTLMAKIHKATSIVKKITWLLVLITMLSWLTVQCYWLFEKYFQHPVEVKIEIKASPILDFPSVTFCNRNPLKRSKMMRHDSPFRNQHHFTLETDTKLYDKAKEMFERSSDISGNFTNHTSVDEEMKNGDFNQWDALNNTETASEYYFSMDQEVMASLAYAEIVTSLDEATLEQYGHSKRDFVMSCRFQGHPCSPANFTYIFNRKYGNCYTFNSMNQSIPKLQTNFAGPLMGLVVEFNIEQSEYINALAADAGVRVMIHERGTYPFPEEDGFSVPPGVLTSVGIKKISYGRLPPPHANCSHRPNRNDWYMKKYNVLYNKKTCLKSCWQDKVIARCGCAFATYLSPNGTKICQMNDDATACCVKDAIETFSLCDLECPETCSENVYETSLSSAKWPSDQYEDYLNMRLSKSNSKFMSDDDKPESEDNLVKLEIFFKDLSYESIEQQKAYESQNLISDVGGQLGLWLGLSAITIGEFIEFFVAVFKATTANMCKKRKMTTIQKLG